MNAQITSVVNVNEFHPEPNPGINIIFEYDGSSWDLSGEFKREGWEYQGE